MIKVVKKWGLTLLFLAFLGLVVLIFNDKISAYSDSLMVIITAVYVVATVEICRANIKSADATREQIEESRRQYEEQNRAFVVVCFKIIRNGLFVLHISNQGKRVADNVRVIIADDFINNFPDDWDKSHLQKLRESAFTLGIGQEMYVGIGDSGHLEKMSKQVLSITVSYSDFVSSYHEAISIDLTQYFWALVYESPVEDARQVLKKIAGNLQSMDASLKQVVHMAKNVEDHTNV